jgi:hypothetical protein
VASRDVGRRAFEGILTFSEIAVKERGLLEAAFSF